MTVEHRGVRGDPQPVGRPVDRKPPFVADLAGEESSSDPLGKHLGAPAGEAVEAGFLESPQDFPDGDPKGLPEMVDLDCGIGLDPHGGMGLSDRGDKIEIVAEGPPGMQGTGDVNLSYPRGDPA